MKNNQGFTLVELLAVIVILLGLSLATGWSVTSILENREEKECLEQQNIAIEAAKIYFSNNNVTTVSLSKLNEEKYLNKKIDRLDINNDYISLNLGDNKYDYHCTKCCN